MATLNTLGKARPADERIARTANTDGQRSFEAFPDSLNAPLCDAHGRLLVRAVGSGGYEEPLQVPTVGQPTLAIDGSAPEITGAGLVENRLVMTRAAAAAPAGPGYPKCIRAFGFSQVIGFVQFHTRDESGGASPPILASIPEVIIPISNGQSFTFGDYLFNQTLAGTIDLTLAVYITLSSTGPTYTPGLGNNLWYYFLGSR